METTRRAFGFHSESTRSITIGQAIAPDASCIVPGIPTLRRRRLPAGKGGGYLGGIVLVAVGAAVAAGVLF
jgi:hypothetical protein